MRYTDVYKVQDLGRKLGDIRLAIDLIQSGTEQEEISGTDANDLVLAAKEGEDWLEIPIRLRVARGTAVEMLRYEEKVLLKELEELGVEYDV